MSLESFNRTSNDTETPSQNTEITRVNVDVLKRRMLDEKKKDKVKRTIIFSTIFVSIGALTFLTY